MEKPYSGLTALIKVNGVTLGYMNGIELNLEKDIAEILQFGAQYKEKIPTIKNWSASSDGTVAFAAGESQEKLFLAFESGELITLQIKLDASVYFEGEALVSSLSISGSPDGELTITAEFEGSGGVTFVLPETVVITIRSGVGGTTNPVGILRVTKGGTLAVTCTPSAGQEAKSYKIGDGAAIDIAANAFTTAALNADGVINVTFGVIV